MEKSEVKTSGRLQYIEPNNLFVNNPGGGIQNGINQPYEDYAFSVNLRVINGNRYDCGLTDDGGDISNNVLEYSSDHGTLSFIDGTSSDGQNGYLTTNFTDISMNNPETNTKECLGIESINIKFSSYFYPQVDIKFVDVRGASLMMPSEYEYYNNGGPNLGKDKTTSNSDFFKAFFRFPYPLFKLSVKGFYGKEVTFDLALLSCNIEFNSNTGNFEANTSFIGYMFGLYADLPFSFIYLAPYIDLYGKKTWEEKKNSKDFYYLANEVREGETISEDNVLLKQEMYTFPELRLAERNCSYNIKKELEVTPEGKTKVEYERLNNKFKEEIMRNYPTKTNHFNWWNWGKADIKENKEGYFFIDVEDGPETNRLIFDDFLKFATMMYEYNEISDKCEYVKNKSLIIYDIFEKLYTNSQGIDHSKDVNEKKASKVTIKYTDEDIKKIMDESFVTLAFYKDTTDKENPRLVFDKGNSKYGNLNPSDFTDLVNELLKRFDNPESKTFMFPKAKKDRWTVKAFFIKDIDYINTLTKINNKLVEEYDRLVEELSKREEEEVSRALGFEPTIKNIYNMIFAHVDTFMSSFYNTLDNIRQKIQGSDTTRKKEVLCGGNIEVDVNDNTLANDEENGGKLPPFTLFYQEQAEKDSKDKRYVILWPGDLPGGENLDEVQLVEAILNAASLDDKSFTCVVPKDNITEEKGQLIPTNYYDLVSSQENPYLDILNEKTINKDTSIVNNSENKTTDILKIFTLRCFYSLLNGSYVQGATDGTINGQTSNVSNLTERAKLVAQLEARNLQKAFDALGLKDGDATENILKSFLALSDDGNTTLANYLKGDKPIFKTSVKKDGASNQELKYSWINPEGTAIQFLPVGTFKQSTLANYINGSNLGKDRGKFLQFNNEGTTVNGFSCRIFPTGNYIKEFFSKYTDGDYKNATKLFPGYFNPPTEVADKFFKAGNLPSMLSYRKTSVGNTVVFLDPLYYAQKSIAARAYLFLMGIPFGTDEKFFLPEKVQNGDYPTLLLLREGAVYWREDILSKHVDEVSEFDPITYKYKINGVDKDAIDDIENNCPAFGLKYITGDENKLPKNVSTARKNILKRYFLKWATGKEYNDDEESGAVITANTETKVEIPELLTFFRDFEQRYALFEQTGETKTLLDKPEKALASEYASYYANYNILKDAYTLTTDGKLGKFQGDLRIDVEIPKVDNKTAEELTALKSSAPLALFDFYAGSNTMIDYSCFDNPNESLTVSRSVLGVALTNFIHEVKDYLNVSAEKLKGKTKVSTSGEEEESFKKPDFVKDNDLKLAVYIALKNVYDKWLCSRKRECWSFSVNPNKYPDSEFNKFLYIDNFYHNVGMKVTTNLSNFIIDAEQLGAFTEHASTTDVASQSFLRALTAAANRANCVVLTVPIMLGMKKINGDEGQNSIADVFKAFPYNEAKRSNDIETSFVVLYGGQKSSHLNNENQSGTYGYKSDGFDIANTWGEIVELAMFSDGDESDYAVPSFGVTFAKQNQSYFKDIKLSMENHQNTEFALRNTLAIATASNKGPRETTLIGQDLYSVFSNYSYSCSVEMMGDAQITPLMYFQLNNIAMWKGAYLITTVSHNITARGMTTTFTGTRQARASVPYKGGKLVIVANEGDKKTPQSQQEEFPSGEDLETSDKLLDKINVDNVSSIVLVLDRVSTENFGSEIYSWYNGILTARVYYNDADKPTELEIGSTIEASFGLRDKIENYNAAENTLVRSLPYGRMSSVLLVKPNKSEEYRTAKDTFYDFTDNKHITVSDMRLGTKECEIIVGSPDYLTLRKEGFGKVSIGGFTPIMLFANDTQDKNRYNTAVIKSIYQSLFNLVKRMTDAHKPISFLITEKGDIPKS